MIILKAVISVLSGFWYLLFAFFFFMFFSLDTLSFSFSSFLFLTISFSLSLCLLLSLCSLSDIETLFVVITKGVRVSFDCSSAQIAQLHTAHFHSLGTQEEDGEE